MAKTSEDILKGLGLNADGSYADDYHKQGGGAAGGKNSGTRTSADILAELGVEARTPYQEALAANRQNAQRTKQTADIGVSTQPTEAQSGWTRRAQYNNLVARKNAIQNRIAAEDPFAAENWAWMNDPEWQRLDAEIKALNESIAEPDSSASPMQEQAAAAISGKTPGDTVPKATAQADGAGRSKQNKPSAIRGNGRASENEPLHYVAEEDRAYNVETAKAAMENAKAAMDMAAKSYDGRASKAYQEAEQAYEEAARRYYVLDDSWIDELYAAQGGGADNSLSNLGQQKEQLQ